MPRQDTKKNLTIAKQNNIPVNSSPNVIVKNNNSLLGSIKEGFGFGIGSTIARNIFGSSPVHQANSKTNSDCIEYNKCLESNDKYECFGNLDQKEYIQCRINN